MNEDLCEPEIMERTLDGFNQSTLDPVGPVPGASGDRFLKELNEMQDLEGNQLAGERY